jgi:VCBS repeat-containing protein/parallel beta-helix repeat protein
MVFSARWQSKQQANPVSRSRRRRRPPSYRPALEGLEGRTLPSNFMVLNNMDNGDNVNPIPGSLRAEIIAANASPGTMANPDTITFAATLAGQTITVMTNDLPALTSPFTTIDATSLETAGSTAPNLVLAGPLAMASGLDIQGGNDTVMGLVINGFLTDGILLEMNGMDTVADNYLGTDLTGKTAVPNMNAGVEIAGMISNNTIGGTTTAARNLISGNMDGVIIDGSGTANPSNNVVEGNYIGTTVDGSAALPNVVGVNIQRALTNTVANNVISGNMADGIEVSFDPSSGNVIQGNKIGTNPAGTAGVGNGSNGVFVQNGAQMTTIGGTTAGTGNLISGNAADGIVFFCAVGGLIPTSGNLVQGNLIGTDVTGTASLPNGTNGVQFHDACTMNNTVGGTATGAGNIIAFNKNDNVLVDTGTGNSILSNSIFSSGHLGIELLNNGNNNQAAPVLTSAAATPGGGTIQGTLASTPNSMFIVQFFANAAANPSGFGEGQIFLGSTTVSTDGAGNAMFSATVTTQITRGQQISATATKLVTTTPSDTSAFAKDVSASGQPPVANNDSYPATGNTALNVNAANGVLANDTDAEKDPLTAVLGQGPTNGSLTLNADGSFTYTPNTGFRGQDTFTYQAKDVDGLSNTATVTITVTGQPPVANNDSYAATGNTALNVTAANGVLANDTDAEKDPLTAVLVKGPSNGTLTLNADGSFTYTPSTGFRGQDTFTYQAKDLDGTSNTATVTITVTGQPPVAINDMYVANANSPLTINAAAGVLANDTDAENDPLTAVLVKGPTNGVVTLNPDGSFTYTPTAGFRGTDTFTYQAKDVDGTSNMATVTLTVNGQVPVANNDTYAVSANTTLTISAPGVLANDTDAENDPLTATLAGAPAHGTLTLNANGSFSYTPANGFTGTDSFLYVAQDRDGSSNVATVTLNVTAARNFFAVDFPGHGVWRFTDATGFQQLLPFDATQVAVDNNGNVFGTFTGNGVWRFTDATSWVKLLPTDANFLTVDGAGKIVAQFNGHGVWMFTDATSWVNLLPADASWLAQNDQGDIAAQFNGHGVWRFEPTTGWVNILPFDATQVAIDNSDNVAATFTGNGFWRFTDATSWQRLSPADASWIGANATGALTAQFNGHGVWRFQVANGLQQILPFDANQVAIDNSLEVIADFTGNGFWRFTDVTSWQQLSGADASWLSTNI